MKSFVAARFKLRGLDSKARYRVRDINGSAAREVGGWELIEQGLQVVLPDMPAAAVLVYQRVNENR
jgi:hypothetical protein